MPIHLCPSPQCALTHSTGIRSTTAPPQITSEPAWTFVGHVIPYRGRHRSEAVQVDAEGYILDCA